VRGNIHQLKREKRRVFIFSAINLLNIKKEGFIPLSLDRLSITVYFSFFASLKNKSEKNDFCRVVDQYLSILIKLSKEAKPEFKEEIIQERKDYQKNYCVQQMKNEKTSMVLLKYFDEKWVNNYIKTVLFDF